MAFFSRKDKVLEFTYRDVPVVIANATRGERCCEQDHRVSDRTCPTCGKKLKHLQVTLVLVQDKVIMQLKRVTPLHARRRAESLIDQLYSEIDSDKPPGVGSNGHGSDKDKPAAKDPPAPPPPRRPPPKRRPPGRRRPGSPLGGDEEIDLPPLPPGFDFDFLKSDGSEDATTLAQLIEAIKKLGWGERANQILEEITRKPN